MCTTPSGGSEVKSVIALSSINIGFDDVSPGICVLRVHDMKPLNKVQLVWDLLRHDDALRTEFFVDQGGLELVLDQDEAAHAPVATRRTGLPRKRRCSYGG